MPTLKIDDREVTVERGTTILDAANELGIQVPTFCYHPGLSVPANCRMCLVELKPADPNRPPPKPVPACYTQVSDGMEVVTKSETVQKVQGAMLEFVLLNHPVDCPICDQAGECVLQDHYFNYSGHSSRLFHKKVHKPKVKDLGPSVVLDAERCILCTRCVRFCDEVAKAPELTVINRGWKSEITTYPGRQLDNPYAANVVDICPVGALTEKDFRFRTRVWMLQTAESVCPECSRGCKIRIDTYENVVRRFKPLPNPDVNDFWMCDAGRHSFADHLDDRQLGATITVMNNRTTEPTSKAMDAATSAIEAAGGSDRVGVIVTPWCTNEDAYVLARLLKQGGVLHGAKVWIGGRADGFGDDILLREDKNPNRRGVTAIFDAMGVVYEAFAGFDADGVETIVVVGDQHALSTGQLDQFKMIPRRVVLGEFKSALYEASSVFLPSRLFWERVGTFTNCDGVVQRFDRAIIAPGTCKSYAWYALKIGQKLGAELDYQNPAEIFADLAGEVAGFDAMDYQALRPNGLKLGGAAAETQTEEGAP